MPRRCHNGTFQTTLAMQVPSVHASPTNKPDLQHSAELHPAGFRHVSDGNGSEMHIASGGMGTCWSCKSHSRGFCTCSGACAVKGLLGTFGTGIYQRDFLRSDLT